MFQDPAPCKTHALHLDVEMTESVRRFIINFAKNYHVVDKYANDLPKLSLAQTVS
jgi:hypothetical protein